MCKIRLTCSATKGQLAITGSGRVELKAFRIRHVVKWDDINQQAPSQATTGFLRTFGEAAASNRDARISRLKRGTIGVADWCTSRILICSAIFGDWLVPCVLFLVNVRNSRRPHRRLLPDLGRHLPEYHDVGGLRHRAF